MVALGKNEKRPLSLLRRTRSGRVGSNMRLLQGREEAMSGPTPQDILGLTHKLQQDLNAAQGKLVTIRSWLAAQPHPEQAGGFKCRADLCGLRFNTEARRNDHEWVVHEYVDGAPIEPVRGYDPTGL